MPRVKAEPIVDESTEIYKFLNHPDVLSKSINTQKSYRVQYQKLYNLLGKNIADTSEKKIIEVIMELDNNNQRQALINIGIVIKGRINNNSTKKLEELRETLKGKLKDDVKAKNVILKDTLPTYKTLINYLEYLYDENEFVDYIINYLLINYQVRNKDLLFDIVSKKKDANDPEKNYMWLSPKKAVFIRRDYKTATTYGEKKNTITDPEFLLALKRVYACRIRDEKCGVFFPNPDRLGFYIQKATYDNLGEGKYMKIIVNHFRNDFDKLQEISENRGTDIKTIASNYDIDMK